MPDLLVRIKKKTDGAAALSCLRPDGSVTWQRQDGQLGRFFPLHDLTHLAVESVLGFRRAFYGLLAELIVGFFDLERATGVLATADDFNEKIRAYFADNDIPPTSFRLTDEQLEAIRAMRATFFQQWRALPPGETLELTFGC